MDIQQRYDIAIIGGGPAGLGAACTAARHGMRVVLLERLKGPGLLSHPCAGFITPVPGSVSGKETAEGLLFPEVDLLVPFSMVIGRPTRQQYISPAGHAIAYELGRPDFPVAVIDKRALLTLLTDKATAAGAELRYGQTVTGLVHENGRIAGVRVDGEVIQAQVVLAAEGVTRTFAQEAGLYANEPAPYCYAFVVSQELEAPAAGEADVAMTHTIGQRYGAPPRVFSTVVVPTPGRANVLLNFFTDSSDAHPNGSLWEQLEKYKRDDARVSHILAGSREVSRSACRMILRQAPSSAVRDGFAGMGDSVGPGGHISIVPSLFLGQQAGRIAAEAVQAGDTSAQGLAAYDELFHAPFIREKDRQSKIQSGLASMADAEIDRVCQTVGRMNMSKMFIGERGAIRREAIRWLLTSLPLVLRDRQLLRQIL